MFLKVDCKKGKGNTKPNECINKIKKIVDYYNKNICTKSFDYTDINKPLTTNTNEVTNY